MDYSGHSKALELKPLTVRIHGLLSCKRLREQPPRRNKEQIALQRCHPLVFGSICEVVTRTERRAYCGVRGVEFKKLRDIRTRDVWKEAARDVIEELVVRPVRVPGTKLKHTQR